MKEGKARPHILWGLGGRAPYQPAVAARAGVFLCSLTFVARLVGARQRFDRRPVRGLRTPSPV